MKKVFFVMVLAGCLAGGVFAQKMAIALDAAPLVRGFIAGEDTNTSKKSYISLSPVFEYALGNNYVIGARADIILGKVGKGTSVSVNHYGLAFLGRWYPLANLQKLYLGAELGFDTCSMEKVDDPLYRGLTLGLRAGWKQMMGKFFVEPSLGYILSKTDPNASMPVTPAGWQIGLAVGMAF